MLTTLLFALEIKLVLKIESKAWGVSRTVLCSVVKQLRSEEKHSIRSRVSPYNSFVL